jgi:hypothetical protein
MPPIHRYTLSFYVPHSALQARKDALFAVGARTYPGGKYSHACFEIPGTGQFRPNEGAVPNLGAVGQLEKVQETKVEVLCVGRETMERSVNALKEAHPDEEVPYYVVKMEDV